MKTPQEMVERDKEIGLRITALDKALVYFGPTNGRSAKDLIYGATQIEKFLKGEKDDG